MQQVTLKGEIVMVDGEFPKTGEQARGFMLVDKELRDVSLSQWSGKRKVLNIVPSIDTPTCQAQARRFNEIASGLPNTVVLVISADLPFAQSRFCGAEGLNNVITLSTLRGRDFQRTYGVLIAEPPLQGLCARAVIVLDENDKVLHAQLVSEITSEPDYDKAIAALTQ